MADPIVVSVEIADSDYQKEFEVDPDDQLVNLLQRVAKEEQIPLRKKSGHPLVWTADGPDVREGHAGEWAELTRTQPLTRISKVVIDRYGVRAPLFTVRFRIPGAAEFLEEKAAEAKRAEIEARMAQRAAERAAEKSAAIGDAEEEFVMDMPPEPPTARPEPPTIQQPPPSPSNKGMATAGAVAGAAALGVAAAAGATGGAENRIRRRGQGERNARTAPPPKAQAKAPPKPKKRPKKSRSSGNSKASSGGGPFDDLPPWAVPAAASIAGLLLVGVLLIVFSGGKEPEPEPTPAPVVEEIGDIEIATPPPAPTPTPAPVEEATPPPMEQFYSRGEFVNYNAKEVSAQITSFTKTNVAMSYKATHAAGGLSHTISLEGRFKVKISDGGGNMNGRAFNAGVTPGKASQVSLRYDDKRLTVSVNGRRAGSWSVPDSGGFPRWRFDLDKDVKISGLRVSAQVE